MARTPKTATTGPDGAPTLGAPEPQFARFRRKMDNLSGEIALDQVASALRRLIPPRVAGKNTPDAPPTRGSQQSKPGPGHGPTGSDPKSGG